MAFCIRDNHDMRRARSPASSDVIAYRGIIKLLLSYVSGSRKWVARRTSLIGRPAGDILCLHLVISHLPLDCTASSHTSSRSPEVPRCVPPPPHRKQNCLFSLKSVACVVGSVTAEQAAHQFFPFRDPGSLAWIARRLVQSSCLSFRRSCLFVAAVDETSGRKDSSTSYEVPDILQGTGWEAFTIRAEEDRSWRKTPASRRGVKGVTWCCDVIPGICAVVIYPIVRFN